MKGQGRTRQTPACQQAHRRAPPAHRHTAAHAGRHSAAALKGSFHARCLRRPCSDLRDICQPAGPVERWGCAARRRLLPALPAAILLRLLLLQTWLGMRLPVLKLLLRRRRERLVRRATLLCLLPAAAGKEVEQAGLVGLAWASGAHTGAFPATRAGPASTASTLLLLLGGRGCLGHEGGQRHLACKAGTWRS